MLKTSLTNTIKHYLMAFLALTVTIVLIVAIDTEAKQAT